MPFEEAARMSGANVQLSLCISVSSTDLGACS